MTLSSVSIFVVPSAVSIVLLACISWILKRWLGTKIDTIYEQRAEAFRAAIQKDNEVSLISFRDQLEKEAQLHASAFASFAAGQKASMERRLDAAETLWNALLSFRSSLPSAFTYMDILTVDEFLGANTHPTGQEIFRELSEEQVLSVVESHRVDGSVDQATNYSLESVRVYIDEYLWSLFSLYRVIMARIWLKLAWSKKDNSHIYWYNDKYARGMIEAVLTSEELDDFDRASTGKIAKLRDKLEEKILNELRRLISGEVSGSESLLQAKKYQQLAREGLGTYVADDSSGDAPMFVDS